MATLKISDLSVGDWVRWGERNVQIAEIGQLVYSFGSRKIDFDNRVTLRYKENIPVYCESVMLADLEPIPITAEILEKNGWVFHKGSRWWVCEIDKDTRANVWLGENGGCRVEVSVMYGELRTWSNYADVKLANAHIHLLQHALRLAGVEKEINL